MSVSRFEASPFMRPSEPTEPSSIITDEDLQEADQASNVSILGAMTPQSDDDMYAGMRGREVTHAIASLKGVAPVINTLASSSIPLDSEEGLRAMEKILTLADRLTRQSVESLGLDVDTYPWASPMGRTILTGVAAKKWEQDNDFSVEQTAEEFSNIIKAATALSLTPEYGADWDMVQPQAALAISLSAAVDNVMAEYDDTFHFFQDRGAVVQQVTETLLESSKGMISDIELEVGELEEPSRTRTLQAVVREGGLLMSRLWRPEAKLALDDIKARDRESRARIILNGGYPLDGLLNRFREAHQTHAFVILSGLTHTNEGKKSPGMSAG